MTPYHRTLTVHTYIGEKSISYLLKSDTTAEDVCIYVAKELKITPVARLLFGLKLHAKNVFIHPGFRFSELQSNDVDFTLRFKVPVLKHLQRLDINAFSYFFHQARHDVINSKVLDLNYTTFKADLIGLSVTDMYREMIEKNRRQDAVLNEYKRFVPKELLIRHRFFMKDLLKKYLDQLEHKSQQSALGVKECYLESFNRLAPTYLCEEYEAYKLEGNNGIEVTVRVDPFHPEHPGILLKEDRKEWTQLCSIDDVWCIAIGESSTIEICGNGIPAHLQFPTIAMMVSFVSLVDGYYRLGVRWTVTYSVTRDLTPPSLMKLQRMKCHGPVGPQFASEKLKKKCSYQRGSFILRESETHYDTYLVDVCMAEGAQPEIFTIEPTIKNGAHGFMLAADGVWHESIAALLASCKVDGSRPWLNYCLPPSEYDKLDHLLLCRAPVKAEDEASVNTELILRGKHDIIDRGSIVLKQELKGKFSGPCAMYRGHWNVDKGCKVDVAIRRLSTYDCTAAIGAKFLEMATSWAQLKGNMTVRLLGMSFMPPTMVLELFPMGPLNKYLQGNRPIVKEADLVEAAACLASAVWYLVRHPYRCCQILRFQDLRTQTSSRQEGKNIIHGNIRCRKVLVSNHDASSMVVKLCDPGLPTYSNNDIHWLPPECYRYPESAGSSAAADIWAFGTTIWEVFAYGETLPDPFDPNAVRAFYSSGGRLPTPLGCPPDVLQILRECWHHDPEQRKQPQGLMRDLNQILYQAFSSRRTHIYTAAYPKRMRKAVEETASFSNSESMISVETAGYSSDSSTPSERTSICVSNMNRQDLWILGSWRGESQEPLLKPQQLDEMLKQSQLDDNRQSDKEAAFELDRDCNVIFQGLIGQGFYGEVYLGTLERIDEYGEPKSESVAIKKLKISCSGDELKDFEQESSIMKKLQHPNIVRLIGMFDNEPEVCIVMEYVPLGSLQSYLKTLRKEPLTHHELLKFALDVATGMEYLGEQNIVHRDLATRNILVESRNSVKISDFGLARIMSNQSGYYYAATWRSLPLQWYALESLQNMRFSPRSDVWSFGVAVWEMFTRGSEPQLPGCEDHNQATLEAALLRGTRLPRPEGCPESVYSRLMAPCWLEASIHRPSFTELCSTIHEIRENLF